MQGNINRDDFVSNSTSGRRIEHGGLKVLLCGREGVCHLFFSLVREEEEEDDGRDFTDRFRNDK